MSKETGAQAIAQDTVELAFKGAQRKGAAAREFDVAIWNVWNVCDAEKRRDILASWFGRFVSVATKDASADVDADADEETRVASETARLDAIAALVDVVNSGDAAAILATFFAPGKRASVGLTNQTFDDAETAVIAATKKRLCVNLEKAGLVVASGKRGIVDGDYAAAAAKHEKTKELVRAKGEGYVWRDAAVLAFALTADPEAVSKERDAQNAFNL